MQSSGPNTLCQLMTYYIAKDLTSVRINTYLIILRHSNQMKLFHVFSVLTVLCGFLRFPTQHYPKIRSDV